jgi:hypothetical protein
MTPFQISEIDRLLRELQRQIEETYPLGNSPTVNARRMKLWRKYETLAFAKHSSENL